MTYDTLKYFESEIKEILDDVLDAVKSKSFPDYCLLLAHAGYQYENEGTFLSPYVIHSRLEKRLCSCIPIIWTLAQLKSSHKIASVTELISQSVSLTGKISLYIR